MQTPSTYNVEQLKGLLASVGTTSLFHLTRRKYLASILERGAIYSLGTLWGLDPEARQNVTGNSAAKTAELGFIDYVFLSPLNRHRYFPQSTIYGRIGFEVETKVLCERDFFTFPFNTGLGWAQDGRKLSDLSTLRECLTTSSKTPEILVRRKVGIDSVKAIHCFWDDKTYVDGLLQQLGLEIPVISYDQGGIVQPMNAKPKNPDFGVRISVAGSERVISKTDLFVSHLSPDVLYFFDVDTNCVGEFKVIGKQLFSNDPSISDAIGTILDPAQSDSSAS